MSNPPTTPTNGNHAKYLSYRLAHDRMKAVIEAGFPLEAVTIAESLITDRLLSFVNFHQAVYVKFIGTHKEYDAIDAESVEMEV